MNLEYLGDALDHWKGSLFEYLLSEGALRHFMVDPMATDGVPWSDADLSLYACLLRINCDQIVPHRASLLSRDRYFSEIERQGDVFLDPDIGVGVRRSPIVKYVKPRELAALLCSASGRVVAVYQHVRGQKTGKRVDGCLAAIGKEIDSVGWCSYESATVAMLFLSDDQARTHEIALALQKLLGCHAKRRIRFGPNRRSLVLSGLPANRGVDVSHVSGSKWRRETATPAHQS